MKFKIFLLIFFGILITNAQEINIKFPFFAGKTYEFVIFQGGEIVKLYENDTIPQNGVVNIVIPKEYTPYTGMCRWLITGTAEGGGLDMAIPGYGFKVSCNSAQPNEHNIIYEGFDAVNELNRLHREQQIIIDKYEIMHKASLLYDNKNPLYVSFEKEKALQVKAFGKFHQDLKNNTNYNARFLPIVNLVTGIAPILSVNQEEKAYFVNQFIVNELNYDQLYTSGHWTGIIQNWIQLHTQFYNDKDKFVKDFTIIHQKITDPKKYTDWVGKITYFLTLYTKDDFIEGIAPLVISSNKITSYEGKTMQVYVKAMIGNQAPDIIITEHLEKVEDHSHKTTIIKSKDFAQKGFDKTLLVFYESGCGPCQELMQKLPQVFENLNRKGIDIISISSDINEHVFKNNSVNFPWKRKYCDYKGKDGVNFINYAVIGTPTMLLIDMQGKIEKKINSYLELLE